ncbi:hypothetical protein PoB_001965900 [Plakobranchus ocellatus]|uniref:Uncharacterized protein n=1 Tax=Plakobranchus ocellatus TaxID=259542 RepID=A0AAV3ZFL5_9GAST|nr:hypothetical protein PoB_001965900 [Plakobranchus ocellatus]
MFMGRQEMNPWRFRRNPNLQRKWKFVNDVMVTQELMGVIQTAKQRKGTRAEIVVEENEDDLSKNNEPDDVCEDHINEDIAVVNNNKTQTQTLTCSIPACSSASKAQLSTRQKTHATVKIVKSKTQHPLRSARTKTQHCSKVYACNRKENKQNPRVRIETKTKSVCSELPALTPQKTMPIAKSSRKSEGEEKRSTSSIGSSCSSLSAVIIFGFGSHHRRDTCDYCGRTACAGMRNRGRKRDKQNGRSGRHNLSERKNDIEGIYDSPDKASTRFQKRLLKRMQQLEIG